EVRYEDLVQAPEATLERVCEFAGLETDAVGEMLDRPRGGLDPRWHRRVAEPISAAPLDRWQAELTPAQVALVELAAGPQLQRFGYEPSAAAAPTAKDLKELRRQRRLRAVKWARYAAAERL